MEKSSKKSEHGKCKSDAANTAREGIRIVKVAAFCFAIVSWVATAQGLQEYVFVGKYWRSYLISFAIQSILFVLNLKLPEYFHRINKNRGRVESGKFRLIFSGYLSKGVIVVLYSGILVASSMFSFVYIVNQVYQNTQYVDADVVLDREYRNYLNMASDYVNEFTKMSRILVSDKLSELLSILPDDDSNSKTLDELKSDAIEKKGIFDAKNEALAAAEIMFNAALDTYKESIVTRWRDPSDIANEESVAENLGEQLTAAQEEAKEAEAAFNLANKAVENYQPPIDLTVNSLLTELLKTKYAPDNVDVIEGLMDDLYSAVVEMDQGGMTNYPEIVARTQELDIALEDYLRLKTAQNDEDVGDGLKYLENDLMTNTIPLPSVTSGGLVRGREHWVQAWNERYMALEKILRNIPSFSEGMIDDSSVSRNSVNVELLVNNKPEEIAGTLSILVRKYLAEINDIEKAWNFLGSEFPDLAWFSLIFAFFLDLSSLLAGLFIYMTDEKRDCKELESEIKNGSERCG